MVDFVSAYSDKPRVDKLFSKPTMTKQAFKAECDINNILRRYKKNMGIDFMNQFAGYLDGKFGDVSAGLDYRTALEQISEGRAVFEAMPADLRARFDNDPVNLLNFMSDEANRDEAMKLGLLKTPSRVPDVNIPVPPAG